MKIIPFPQSDGPRGEQTLAEIEAALHGHAVGVNAEAWRRLRSDVRSLAPPMSAEVERELRRRIQERARVRRKRASRAWGREPLARLNAWLASGPRARLLALSGVCLSAAIVTLLVLAPWHSGHAPTRPVMETVSGTVAVQPQIARASAAVAEAPARAEGSAQPGRVQQHNASVTLAAKPEEVQSVADQIAQLAARDGGFVQSSHVQVQASKPGEANLNLSVPSERLSGTLAELGRLAPMRAESQSLQDITSEYDAAKRKLGDDVAERQALLRALARASTQGEIESIHARLSLVAGAITRDRAAFESVSKRGTNSIVEVTVLGNAHAGDGGLTPGNAWHDAGDVLRVALAVLIIALAALVPLAVSVLLGALTWRRMRRRLRERALS